MIVTQSSPNIGSRTPGARPSGASTRKSPGARPPAAPSTRCGPGSTCRSLISAFGCRTSPTTASR